MSTAQKGQIVQEEENRKLKEQDKQDHQSPKIGEGSAEGAKPHIKHETKREDQIDNTPGNVAGKESSGQKQDAKGGEGDLSKLNEQLKGSDADFDQSQSGGLHHSDD